MFLASHLSFIESTSAENITTVAEQWYIISNKVYLSDVDLIHKIMQEVSEGGSRNSSSSILL